jgi:3-methyladenine DNA glycosylase Tag
MKSLSHLLQQAKHFYPTWSDAELLGPRAANRSELIATQDDRILSAMTWRIFCAGLKRSLVDSKWPAFEKAFFGFDPEKVSLMSDDHLDALMQNRDLIRHFGKIKATRINALMIHEVSQKQGGFGHFLADWPVEDTVVGLWGFLKKEGAQLGGNSGAYALRIVGRDSPVLTDDVVVALKAQGVIDKRPTAKRDLTLVQEAFNHWHNESGFDLCQISRLLARSIG